MKKLLIFWKKENKMSRTDKRPVKEINLSYERKTPFQIQVYNYDHMQSYYFGEQSFRDAKGDKMDGCENITEKQLKYIIDRGIRLSDLDINFNIVWWDNLDDYLKAKGKK
jgi:hypothetical protein